MLNKDLVSELCQALSSVRTVTIFSVCGFLVQSRVLPRRTLGREGRRMFGSGSLPILPLTPLPQDFGIGCKGRHAVSCTQLPFQNQKVGGGRRRRGRGDGRRVGEKQAEKRGVCWEPTAAASRLKGVGSVQGERGEAGESLHGATELPRVLFQPPPSLPEGPSEWGEGCVDRR